QKGTVLESYDWASVVVITQVLSVDKSPKAPDRVVSTKMIVEKAFKGTLKAGDEMIFAQGGGADCLWTFREQDIGRRFLFYLGSQEKEGDQRQTLWFAGTCGRSRDVMYAADDLLYLENLSKARGRTRLSGILMFSEASAKEGDAPRHVG